MDFTFWLKVVLSFAVGRGWVVVTKGPAAASSATILMPLARGVNGVFVVSW